LSRTIQSFDYVIVGGGSAGGLLLYRLSQNLGCRVLLLEAGPTDRHWTIRMPAAARHNFTGGPRNWAFSTEPEPHMDDRCIYQPRGKTLGGSSSINGMVFVRGHANDYDNWAASGAEGWGYDDLLPYFKSMERYLPGADDFRGGDGPIVVQPLGDNHPIEQAFLEAAEQAGFPRTTDYNGARQEGVSPFDANIDGGYRCSTGLACIEPAAKRPNVSVKLRAQALRVLFDGRRAIGIEFLHEGRIERVHAGMEVVLSAGAIQSPHLLLLSGIGPPDQLRRHGIDVRQALPGVGENLQDHLEVHIKHHCPKGLSKNGLLRWDRMVRLGLQWLVFKSGAAATTQSRIGGFIRSAPEVDYPNLQYHFWPYFLEGWSPPPHQDGYCFDVGPVRPESRGWVRLADADPLKPPVMRLNGLSTERDRAEFRTAIRITRDIAAQSAFDFCRGPEVAPGPAVQTDTEIDAYVRANANSAYHPSCSCRIGTDEFAVVDSKLKVHGIDGLRVADASVFPTITNGNTNAPSMMVGERAAALIRDD